MTARSAHTLARIGRGLIFLGAGVAVGLALAALLAALFPAAAQLPTPYSGYHGVDIPRPPSPAAARPPSLADRAALQRDLLGLDTVAPAAGGDPADPADPALARPHVLLLSIRANIENMSAGKAPMPSADQLARRGVPFFMQGIFPERRMWDFDDWWACAAIAAWWRADGDPRIVRADCRPKGTLPAERAAAPEARR